MRHHRSLPSQLLIAFSVFAVLTGVAAASRLCRGRPPASGGQAAQPVSTASGSWKTAYLGEALTTAQFAVRSTIR